MVVRHGCATAPFLAAAAAALIVGAKAHEHHDDKIPEGEVVSPDPLVWNPAPKMGLGSYAQRYTEMCRSRAARGIGARVGVAC